MPAERARAMPLSVKKTARIPTLTDEKPSSSVRPLDVFWTALLERDPAFDGRFFYAVMTTGVYCRPSCASRRPRRENVTFYRSAAEAASAGYRPCKRCRPDRDSAKAERAAEVEKLCRLIEASDESPSIEALASYLKRSASYTQRLFKESTGVTPMKYAAQIRRTRVSTALRTSTTVTEAIHSSGYGSAARFYATSDQELGMKTAAYRAGGAGEVLHFTFSECTLGMVLVAATKRGICAILLGDDPRALLKDLKRRFPRATLTDAAGKGEACTVGDDADGDWENVVLQVVALVDRPASPVNLPLDIRGTAFQQRVWAALKQIPAGQTVSYSKLAERLGVPQGARAVAGACAKNPLAVAVPCHRVVREDGALSGYRWGVDRKRALLAREREK